MALGGWGMAECGWFGESKRDKMEKVNIYAFVCISFSLGSQDVSHIFIFSFSSLEASCAMYQIARAFVYCALQMLCKLKNAVM